MEEENGIWKESLKADSLLSENIGSHFPTETIDRSSVLLSDVVMQTAICQFPPNILSYQRPTSLV